MLRAPTCRRWSASAGLSLRRRLAGLATSLAGALLLATLPLVLPHALTPAAVAAAPAPGVVLPDGRLVTPAGSPYDPRRAAGDASYDLGDFPLGLALSPDGRYAVVSLNGYGTGQPHGFNSFCEQNQSKAGVACPGVPTRLQVNPELRAPDEGLDVVDLQTGKVVQVYAVPPTKGYFPNGPSSCAAKTLNCFGQGLTFSPDGTHLYATGGGDDSIYDFTWSAGTLTLAHRVAIASLSASAPSEPVIGTAAGYPRAIAVAKTARGLRLLVGDEFDSTIELFDIDGGKAPTLLAQGLVAGGAPGALPVAYLYAAATSPDGQWGYITAEGTGVVYAINLAALEASGPLTTLVSSQAKPLAPAIALPVPLTGVDHPTGLSVSPDGMTLAVAGANSDTVGFVPLVAGIPTGASITTVRLSAVPGRPGTVIGSTPDDVTWSPDGHRAYAALAGDDAVAVLDTSALSPATPPTVLGFIPTGWYPTAVGVGPKDGRIYAVAAKGLGSRYVAGVGGYTPAPGKTLPTGAAVPSSDYYDAENMPGLLTRVTPPSSAQLATYSATAATDVLHAGGLDQRPAQSPIPAVLGDPSPIKHIVYIVRENRTFDQVFGDLALTRKDVDADPYDQTLAAATPNAHALAGRYAIADHFFSDGEASVQGHWWTSSAVSNDYIEKSWRQNYSPRGRPGDAAVVPVTVPEGCSIFQDVQRYAVTHPSFTYRNYGELVGLADPNSNVGSLQYNLCSGGGAIDLASNSFSDPNYPGQQQLVPDDRTRAAEFLKDSGLKLDGSSAGNGNSLRNFNYLILSEDHTSGLAGKQTPRSEVAQNDAALGQIISGLSKSKYWSSTAVIAVEDDSQDGIDHVDGHRNVLVVASPWTKHVSGDGCQVPGYVGHNHYDQAGVLRTIELILGLPPLSAYDAGATPLYDLFQSKVSLSPADLKPYDVAPAPPFIDETVASLPKTAKNQTLIAYSRTLNTTKLDADEPGIESVLWQTLRPETVPLELARKVGLAGGASDEAGETASASLDTTAVDLSPVEARPGRAPDLSTVTGLPLAPHEKVVCANPVVLKHPAKPGQLPTHVRKPGGSLAATGLSWWPAWLGLGLVLLAVGLRLSLRRAPTDVGGR
ncbi:MAG TPA: hypothetical protein VHE83_14430 [Mycobacteriales bacterium]|nr:hypothetical protein [Mycobacteriales bacterium]